LESCNLYPNQLSGLLDIASDVHIKCILIGPGPIPKEIGNLQMLKELWLQTNQLEGKIGGHSMMPSRSGL
jgi:hypothetical protein